MARTPKLIVERNLLKVPVLIEDAVSYSKYFEVSRLNPNFHAGKNGFLIRGTQYLKQGSTIQVEVLDRYGKTVFSNIVGNYSEGDARLVVSEITQKTRKGPGKLVVVGTAINYEDGSLIPASQQQSPNVRWVFPIDIDPSRRNTSKLILQNTPARILNGLSVTRTDFNTTSRTDAFVTSSTYTASLDYDFEGHRSDGYAITMVDSSGTPIPFFDDVNIDGYFTGSLYKREIRNLYDTGTLVPDSQSIVLDYVTSSVYTPLFKTLNETLAITEKSIKFGNGDDYLNPVLYSGSYSRVVTEDDLGGNLVRKLEEEITSSVIFEYPTETLTTSTNNSSILNFRIPYTQTYSGEIAKVRISAKEANPEITAWNLLTEFNPGERNILITGSNTGNISVGRFLTDDLLQNHWQSGLVNITDYENSQSVNPITLVTSSAEILEGFYADHTESAVPYFFGTQDFYQLYQGVQYTLKYDAVYNPTYVSSSTTYSTTDTGSVKAYLTRIGSDAESKASSSVVIATKNGVENTYGNLLDTINTRDSDKSLYERQVNFTHERDGVAYLRFVVDSGFWNFSNFIITPSIEYGYNPDEIVVYAEDTILTGTTYLFRIEFIGWAGDISDEFISDPIIIPPKGGGASLRLITDRTLFTFDSLGDPFPTAQTASVEVILTNVTDTPTFTLVNDLDVPVDTQFYSASNGNLNFDIYVGAFGEQTGSLGTAATSSLLLTVSASAGGDIVQDKLRFVKTKDAADGTPGAPGAAGQGARAVKLTLSDYSVIYVEWGNYPTPTSITASATAQNLEGNDYEFNFYRTGSLLLSWQTGSLFATASFLVPNNDYNPNWKQENIQVQVTESATTSPVGVARDSEDFVGLSAGENGWTVLLTNTSHTLPADNDGNVTSFVGSGTKIEVLYGASNLLPWTSSAEYPTWPVEGYFSASVFESSSVNQPDKTGSVVLQGSDPTYVQFSDLTGMEVASNLGSITYQVAARTGSTDYVFYQVQSFSKSKQGDPGSNGSGSRAVKLTLSDYSIVYSEFGDNPDPTSVTASAYYQNIELPVTFSFYRTGSELITYEFSSLPNNPVTASFTIPPTDNYTAHLVEVAVSESANGVAFDSNEYFGVTPGVDGWTIILTNENHTFPADFDGTVNNNYAGGGTDIEILYGATNFSASLTTPTTGEFSASIYESSSILADYDPTVESVIYLRYGDNPPNNMIADNASITYKITAVSGSQTFEFYKKQSFTKSKNGEDGYIYYIDTLNGTEFKTDANGLTVPDYLYFATRRSTGSAIQDLPSGSIYQLIYSGSEIAVTGEVGSAYYTASSADVTNRAELQFYSGSTLIDTISITDLTDGVDGHIYYIDTLNGTEFKTDNNGITVPDYLYFATRRSVGSDIQDLVSGSDYKLIYSGSEDAVTGEVGSAYYTASSADVTNRAELQFYSSSVLVDTISVTDLTDGQDGSDAPIITLTVSGSTSFVSSSGTTDPTGDSSVTGSLLQNGVTYYVSSSLTPSGTTGFTTNLIGSSSNDVSGSWTTTVLDGSAKLGVQFKFYSGSNEVANQTFTIIKDGIDGINATTVFLTNESHTFSAANDGTVSNASAAVGNTTASFFTGSSLYEYDGTAPYADGSYRTGSLTQTGISVTSTTATLGGKTQFAMKPVNGAAITGDTGYVDIPFIDNDTGDTFTKRFSFSKSKVGDTGPTGDDGAPGPGIVFRGVWDTDLDYIYDLTDGVVRRDAVLWSISGTPPYQDYYMTSQSAASTIDAPHITTGSYWTYLGQQEFFVAAKVAIFEESYVQNTLNVGTNNGGSGSAANITIHGGTSNPYMSIGQDDEPGGDQGYAKSGIFVGMDSGVSKLSLSGSEGRLLWDGSTLNVDGVISASSGYFSGSLYALSGSISGRLSVGSSEAGQGSIVWIGADTYPTENGEAGGTTPSVTNYNPVTLSAGGSPQHPATLGVYNDGEGAYPDPACSGIPSENNCIPQSQPTTGYNASGSNLIDNTVDWHPGPSALKTGAVIKFNVFASGSHLTYRGTAFTCADGANKGFNITYATHSLDIIQNGVTTTYLLNDNIVADFDKVTQGSPYTIYYTSNSTESISFKSRYFTYIDQPACQTAISPFTYAVSASVSDASYMAISDRGIHINVGEGEVSLTDAALTGGSGGGGGGISNINAGTSMSVAINSGVATITHDGDTETEGSYGSSGIASIAIDGFGHVKEITTATYNNYSHPTQAAQSIDIDTGPLTGATVISDLDFNVTVNTLGHTTSAAGAVSTRNLTLANLGYTGATDANNYVHPNHSGHVTSTGDGATVLTVSGITGQTDFGTGDVADADELLISDAGAIRRIDFSVLRNAIFADVSSDVTIAAGGAATVADNSHNHTFSNISDRTTAATGITSVGTITTGTWSATTIAVDKGGTGQTSYIDGELLIGNTTGNTLTKATLTGTTNQITVTNGAGSITLSTPQDLHTGASPTFAALKVNGDLTVDTTTLKVDSVNNRVGIGVSPSYTLDVNGAANFAGLVYHRIAGTPVFGASGGITYYYGNTNGIAWRNAADSTTQMVLDSTGRVGIGVNPSTTLDVNGDLTVRDADSSLLIGNGGTNACKILAAAGDELYVGANDTYALRFLTNTGKFVVMDNGGRFGIGTTSPSYGLQVSGTGVEGTIYAQVDVQTASDIRLKNVLDIPVQGLETIDKMTPIKYNLKNDEDETPKTHLGFSAQELLELVPEVVGQDGDGYYNVSYGKLVPVLVKAIQELTEEVRELKKKIGE